MREIVRAVLQRVTSGCVTVDQTVVGAIETGLVILLGVTHNDSSDDAAQLAQKVVHLRIFADELGKMNRSVLDIGGEILVVSQFTLYADTRKGRRPSYTQAAPPDVASPLVEAFVEQLSRLGIKHVSTGVFSADMAVKINNDGPVTIILETDPR